MRNLFVFSTIGSIFTKTTFEKFFTIITAMLVFLTLRLALGKNAG
ncbi:MAG: hypothetical protein ACR2MT_15375 [Aurantibacter sp.]